MALDILGLYFTGFPEGHNTSWLLGRLVVVLVREPQLLTELSAVSFRFHFPELALNHLFPDRPITVRGVAIDHGVMNLIGTSIGGVPMCHGAGGMAGHVRFGARTGGSLVILGVLVLVVGLFFADSVGTLFNLFPPALLGVILMFGGLELAAGVRPTSLEKADRYVMAFTAGVALWNMGAAYLGGLALWYGLQRGWLRL